MTYHVTQQLAEFVVSTPLSSMPEEVVDRAKEKTSEAARAAGDAISDAGILTRIKAQLVAGGVTGTDVDVSNGDVVIRGEVKSAAEKEKAEVVARTTNGVKSVKNLLTVRKH